MQSAQRARPRLFGSARAFGTSFLAGIGFAKALTSTAPPGPGGKRVAESGDPRLSSAAERAQRLSGRCEARLDGEPIARFWQGFSRPSYDHVGVALEAGRVRRARPFVEMMQRAHTAG